MKLGLLGAAGSGKSTLLAAVTDGQVAPPSTRPTVRVVKVPDPRLDRLYADIETKKCTAAHLELLDPGAGDAASQQKAVEQVDGLIYVLRAFQEEGSTLPVAPLKELDTWHSELLVRDLQIVENRLDRLARQKGRSQTPEQDRREQAILERLHAAGEAGRSFRLVELAPEEEELLRSFQFLTRKPYLVVLNEGEGEEGAAAELVRELGEAHPVVLAVCARLEAEIAELPVEERVTFLEELGLEEPASDRLIRAAYEAMGVLTFFTFNKDELRAWTLRRGATALEAAGKIHTDMARGFIRAEVVAFEDYAAHGGLKGVKAAGRFRLEGKGYAVQDGDLLQIRFNI